jgi:aldehyde dehydrogenase (NAD+)
MDKENFLRELSIHSKNPGICSGRQWANFNTAAAIDSYCPIDDSRIATISCANEKNYEEIIKGAQTAFKKWQLYPAPQRGQVIASVGMSLKKYKKHLGQLVSYEMGKSIQEGLGEVQEMIDICDFAVGLSRQLYGKTMHSEREAHRMYEQWHPLGLTAIITAFNFPVAVWAWNMAIASICGNVSIWKPSEKTPLCAIACFNILKEALEKHNVPEGVFNLLIGDIKTVASPLSKDSRISLVSATGSCKMGQKVGTIVAQRFGKSILELGGNNAIIISPSANLDLAIPATVFGAIGTAGQRCTTTRRLIVHESIFEKTKKSLIKAYQKIKIGSPFDQENHMGPLIDNEAVVTMQKTKEIIKKQGGKILYEGSQTNFPSKCYTNPCLVEAEASLDIMQEETFAPILYLVKYKGEIGEAIKIQNNVKQGLSSAIFTQDLQEAENFLSHKGSDCGIANVNIGTSGAEIGGAFGGEKETGGGREAGSDAWRAYMRRQTTTINFSKNLPLAQGIEFNI